MVGHDPKKKPHVVMGQDAKWFQDPKDFLCKVTVDHVEMMEND